MSPRRLGRLLLLILLLPLASSDAAEWTNWNPSSTAQVRRDDTPVLLLISAGYCRTCQEIVSAGLDTDRFMPLVLDRNARPELASAYLAFAEAFEGEPVELPVAVALTPFLNPVAAKGSVTPESLESFADELESNWSRERFLETALLVRRLNLDGWAPSVPSTPGQRLREIYERLLQGRFSDADSETLLQMSRTALYDQLGGGFHRAARDDAWTTPEFEKVLSDQALAVLVYTAAWQVTGETRFSTVATATSDLLLRQFLDPVTDLFFDSLGSHTEEAGSPSEELLAATEKLLEVRSDRPQPERDERVLTTSTALAISALARAGIVFGETTYSAAAEKAVEALLSRNMADDRIYAVRTDELTVPASQLDYAFLTRSLIDLYEGTFDPAYLVKAFELQGLAASGVGGDRVPEMLRDITPDPELEWIAGRNLVQLGAASGLPSWVESGSELEGGDADRHRLVILAADQPSKLASLLDATRERFRPHLLTIMVETTAERDALSPHVKVLEGLPECNAGKLGERVEWNGKIDCSPIALLCRGTECDAIPPDPAQFPGRLD